MLPLMLRATLALLLAAGSLVAAPPAKEKDAPKEPPKEEPKDKPAAAKPDDKAQPKTVLRDGSVTIAGNRFDYTAETATIVLKTDDGKPRASVFHVSYLRKGVKDPANRPVLFAFNGGPGSSAVWLHLGALGPKRVAFEADGTRPPTPPARVTENPQSILDLTDLVFVDPVSTGYSRAADEAKSGEFHGLEEDIESVGDFIRRWITDHERWSSPKYLLGESYGAVRAAGLARHLQSRFGMSLNGIVLLSGLLDFRTLDGSPGDDLANLVYLPSFTSVALHHGKIQGDRETLVAAAREFAFGAYSAALLKGADLPAVERDATAKRLAELTGLTEKFWTDHHLRVDPTVFRAELLRDKGLLIGRFDARVTEPTADPAVPAAGGDPSYDYPYGAFSTAMLDYLASGLGWKDEQPYEILTGKVNPWRWGNANNPVNVGHRLSQALADNPHLRVLILCGHTDLATPGEGIAHSLRHMLDLPAARRSAIRVAWFDAGHMFYLNPPDLAKMRADLTAFLAPAANR